MAILRGVEQHQEQDPRLLLRDTRTLGQRISDFLENPLGVSSTLVVLAVSSIVFPGLADVALITGMVIFCIKYSRRSTLPFRFFCSLCLCFLLAGCASSPPLKLSTATVDTTSLDELQHLATRTLPEANGINPLRLQALQQAALEVGAQGGLARRSDEINQNLKKEARQLDQTFNFHPMVLHNNVLPPVLVEGRTILDQHSPDSVRIADHTYKILRQAHFITASPTWQNYLWMDYKKPPPPDPSLLPKSEEEEAVWQSYVLKGWNEGIEQANTIFNTNLARLKEDYAGMTLYRKLLAQHMISEPFVATTQLGITGDSDQININDQVLRITALPALETDSGKWQTAVIDPKNDPKKWRQVKTP